MDSQIERKQEICAAAETAEWEEVVALSGHLTTAQKAFLKAHPPGLVSALWRHFDATHDRCGCATPSHERSGCPVRLIERLLLEEEAV